MNNRCDRCGESADTLTEGACDACREDEWNAWLAIDAERLADRDNEED